jgi:hypothetical protein
MKMNTIEIRSLAFLIVLTAMLILWLMGIVHAQQTLNTRSFSDRNGAFAGQEFDYGKTKSFSDRNGAFSGSATRNSDGSTSFYDRNGHFSGQSFDTGRRR